LIARATNLDLARWLPPIRPLLLPLEQPDGHHRVPVIQPGESAVRFQTLARAASDTGCDLLAPTEGRVLGHTGAPTPEGWCEHALELRCDTASTSGVYSLPEPMTPSHFDELLELTRRRGLIDLVAARPLAASLAEAADAGADHLVINALDPLPDCLWHEHLLRFAGRTIADAASLVANVLRIPNVHFVSAFRQAGATFPLRTAARVRAVTLPGQYPQAHPRLVAFALFGDRFPYDRPIAHGGVLILDAQTLFAMGEALASAQPFVWRWVFVGGDAIERPGLYRVFIGTRVTDVLAAAGPSERVAAVVAGGLLNGTTVTSPDCIVSCFSSAVHFLSDAAMAPPRPCACVRCGWCHESCPVSLDPRAIYQALETRLAPVPAKLHAGACIECGLCSYVCPAELELAHAARIAKRLATNARPLTIGATSP
jgi:electron transport complex protein RnfC